MSFLFPIRSFIQQHAEAISEALEVDVTIIDENCIRVGGTGPHKHNIGCEVPHGSFFRKILATGHPTLLDRLNRNEVCHGCDDIINCQERIAIGYPIFCNEKTVGVIGIISFGTEQEKSIMQNIPKMWSFLKHMSSLIESMLTLKHDNDRLYLQIQDPNCKDQKSVFGSLIGCSPQFLGAIQKARQMVASTSTVLIQGESGTGKELLAKAIHKEGLRSKHPFIIVNCPSIPESLFESELFGYTSGSFTGAAREGRIGKFEMANKGTIFLDEIGDIPLSVQAKLLRVLQEKTIDKIGGKESLLVDVRVIAATNRNLEDMVAKGDFREDLYYRLNVIPITIPPLRKRPLDIELYVKYFLDKWCAELGKERLQVDSRLLKWLVEFRWPGNVRQLENVVEYMVNMAPQSVISPNDLPPNLATYSTNYETVKGLADRLDEYEKKIMENMLASPSLSKDKNAIAKLLKISLATLYRKLDKHQIKYDK